MAGSCEAGAKRRGHGEGRHGRCRADAVEHD